MLTAVICSAIGAFMLLILQFYYELRQYRALGFKKYFSQGQNINDLVLLLN